MLSSSVASDNAFSKAKFHDRQASEWAEDQNEGSQSVDVHTVDKGEGQDEQRQEERKPTVCVNMVRMMCEHGEDVCEHGKDDVIV